MFKPIKKIIMLGIVTIQSDTEKGIFVKEYEETKEEVLTTLNHTKELFQKTQIIYLLDGSVEANYKDGYNGYDFKLVFQPYKIQ